MKDFVTNAYTLRVTPSRDFDKTAHLFTEDFGRIEARVVSGRKPLSKFSPHLEPMRRVTVRLAQRKGFTITDVLSEKPSLYIKNNNDVWSHALKSFSLIHFLTPKEMKDDSLWNILENMNETGIINPKEVLSCLGYDIHHALCDVCGSQFIVGFNFYSHEFLCIACAEKFSESRIVIL